MSPSGPDPVEMLDRVAAWLDAAGMTGVYTGGSPVPLYLEPAAATEYRPTRDVDWVVDTPTYAAYQDLVGRLRKAGLLFWT